MEGTPRTRWYSDPILPARTVARVGVTICFSVRIRRFRSSLPAMEVAYACARSALEGDCEKQAPAPVGALPVVRMRRCRKVGNSATCYKPARRKSARHRMRPAAIREIDDTGVAAKFQGQTLRVSRCCGCRQVEPKDVGDVNWNPASGGMDGPRGLPSSASGRRDGDGLFPEEGRGEASGTRIGPPNPETGGGAGLESSSPSPGWIPAPSPFPLSIRAASSPSLSAQSPPAAPSFDRECTQSQAPAATRSDYNPLTYNELHHVCLRRGHAREDSKALPGTRLPTTDAVERKRVLENENAMDTSGEKPATAA